MIIFDIEGTIAHFRKFYTNSSSLSYTFPPRTVITGLIAGILGYERDSYYDKFSFEKCKVGLSIRKPIRKLMQTINYIRTKDKSEFTGAGGHTQIPVEFVLPVDEILRYRVYFYHTDKNLMDELKERIKTGNFIYPPYLGITECPAITKLIDENPEVEYLNFNLETSLVTVILTDAIESIEFKEGYKFIKEDRVPITFNSERRITKVGSYIYEQYCKPIPIENIKIKENIPIFRVKYKENNSFIEESGIFME